MKSDRSKFVPFDESMCDKLYDSGAEGITIKTKCDSTITCTLKWRQGWGDNYYFYSEALGTEFYPEDVKEVLVPI